MVCKIVHKYSSPDSGNCFVSAEFCFSAKDLQKYLDPAYTDEMTMSEEAKEEVVLAGEGVSCRTVACYM
jgi:hypothetical protein